MTDLLKYVRRYFSREREANDLPTARSVVIVFPGTIESAFLEDEDLPRSFVMPAGTPNHSILHILSASAKSQYTSVPSPRQRYYIFSDTRNDVLVFDGPNLFGTDAAERVRYALEGLVNTLLAKENIKRVLLLGMSRGGCQAMLLLNLLQAVKASFNTDTHLFEPDFQVRLREALVNQLGFYQFSPGLCPDEHVQPILDYLGEIAADKERCNKLYCALESIKCNDITVRTLLRDPVPGEGRPIFTWATRAPAMTVIPSDLFGSQSSIHQTTTGERGRFLGVLKLRGNPACVREDHVYGNHATIQGKGCPYFADAGDYRASHYYLYDYEVLRFFLHYIDGRLRNEAIMLIDTWIRNVETPPPLTLQDRYPHVESRRLRDLDLLQELRVQVEQMCSGVINIDKLLASYHYSLVVVRANTFAVTSLTPWFWRRANRLTISHTPEQSALVTGQQQVESDPNNEEVCRRKSVEALLVRVVCSRVARFGEYGLARRILAESNLLTMLDLLRQDFIIRQSAYWQLTGWYSSKPIFEAMDCIVERLQLSIDDGTQCGRDLAWIDRCIAAAHAKQAEPKFTNLFLQPEDINLPEEALWQKVLASMLCVGAMLALILLTIGMVTSPTGWVLLVVVSICTATIGYFGLQHIKDTLHHQLCATDPEQFDDCTLPCCAL